MPRYRTAGVAGALALLAAAAVPAMGQTVAYDAASNRSYVLNPTVQSWADGEAAAVARGGHLASITSQAENNLIHAIAPDAYIGFTDLPAYGGTEFGDTSGQQYPPNGNRGAGWVWTDGSAVTFQNWGAGEPNNSGGENVAQIRNDGQWNDLSNQTLPSIQKITGRVTGPVRNGHEYVIVPGGTWADARAQARALGGDLVTINDADENAFVDGLVNGETWIGHTDDPAYGGTEFGDTSGAPNRGAGWVWSDGSPVTFQNWRAGEPNNAGATGENFAELVDGGGWNDLPASFTRVGVAEIPVPEPASLGLVAVAGLLALRRRRLAR